MNALSSKVEKAFRLRWLFIPAVYAFVASFSLRKDESSDKEQLEKYTFGSLNVMIVYFGIIFIVVSQITREPLPYIIMT